jgi:uncharacterized integral membrane protein
MSIRLILSLVIAVFAVVFTLQNADTVPVRFVAWRFESPLALVIALTLIIGAAASALLAAPNALRRSWQLSREERHSAELESRVKALEQEIDVRDRRIRELEVRSTPTTSAKG